MRATKSQINGPISIFDELCWMRATKSQINSPVSIIVWTLLNASNKVTDKRSYHIFVLTLLNASNKVTDQQSCQHLCFNFVECEQQSHRSAVLSAPLFELCWMRATKSQINIPVSIFVWIFFNASNKVTYQQSCQHLCFNFVECEQQSHRSTVLSAPLFELCWMRATKSQINSPVSIFVLTLLNASNKVTDQHSCQHLGFNFVECEQQSHRSTVLSASMF